MTATAQTFRPATQRQFDFISRLLKERDSSAVEALVSRARASAVAGTMSSTDASAMIEILLDQPKAEAPAAAEVEAGIYSMGDRVFRVYFGQNAGRMLVKEVHFLDEGVEYEYLGSARVLPVDAVRLPVEEVGALGVTSGECLICGRLLTDPESVDFGVGPICRANY